MDYSLIRGAMFINFHFIFISFFFNGCMEFKVGASFIQKATFNILPNFLGTTFIPCPASIPDSRVTARQKDSYSSGPNNSVVLNKNVGRTIFPKSINLWSGIREPSQIMFAFWHLTTYVPPLVCTFYLVNLAFFWPPTHP